MVSQSGRQQRSATKDLNFQLGHFKRERPQKRETTYWLQYPVTLHLFNNAGNGLHMQDYVCRAISTCPTTTLLVIAHSTISKASQRRRYLLISIFIAHDFGSAHHHLSIYCVTLLPRIHFSCLSASGSKLEIQDYQDTTPRTSK